MPAIVTNLPATRDNVSALFCDPPKQTVVPPLVFPTASPSPSINATHLSGILPTSRFTPVSSREEIGSRKGVARVGPSLTKSDIFSSSSSAVADENAISGSGAGKTLAFTKSQINLAHNAMNDDPVKTGKALLKPNRNLSNIDVSRGVSLEEKDSKDKMGQKKRLETHKNVSHLRNSSFGFGGEKADAPLTARGAINATKNASNVFGQEKADKEAPKVSGKARVAPPQVREDSQPLTAQKAKKNERSAQEKDFSQSITGRPATAFTTRTNTSTVFDHMNEGKKDAFAAAPFSSRTEKRMRSAMEPSPSCGSLSSPPTSRHKLFIPQTSQHRSSPDFLHWRG